MRRICIVMACAVLVISLLVSCATAKDQGTVTGVKLDKYTMYLYAPDTIKLGVTVNGTAENKAVVFESSNPDVVAIDPDGTVHLLDSSDKTETVQVQVSSVQDPTKKTSAVITVFPSRQANWLMAGPGHDSSTSQTISWHSQNPDCVLELTDANSTQFTQTIAVACNKNTLEWNDGTSYYRYRIELEGLEPDSTYQYRVKNADGSVSEAGTFKTAGSDGTFHFLWLSDNHTQANNPLIFNVDTAIDRANAILGQDINFVLFSGDMVNKGQIYNNWFNWQSSDRLHRNMFAFLVGNHEYYPAGKKNMDTSAYYLDMVAVPDDDADVLDSNYWFLYENVLFICLDSIGREDDGTMNYANRETLEMERIWLESVVEANKGKYDYIIVSQHYSMLEGENSGTGAYEFWAPVMDKCRVDLVLASDTHTYSRSYTLYGDQVAEDGTVYMTSPITEYQEEKAIVNRPELTGNRCAFYVGEKGSGFVVVSVTPQAITLDVYGSDGIQYDSLSVNKKNR
ncbi:MAG: metallophosphoesterase [Sphaerochaetaceae bacterium]|nr:metallophosphoesterase [Sphaerochaetaceae bacterium]